VANSYDRIVRRYRCLDKIRIAVPRSDAGAPGAVKSDLGGCQRTAADRGRVLSRQPFEIMQNERGAVVLRQTVNHAPHAGIYLVRDDPILDLLAPVRQLGCFANLDDLEPALRLREGRPACFEQPSELCAPGLGEPLSAKLMA